MKHIKHTIKLLLKRPVFWACLALGIWAFFIPNAKSDLQTSTSPEQGVLPLYGVTLDASFLAFNAPTSLDWTKDRLINHIRNRSISWGVNPTIMLRLANCESGTAQFKDNGSVVRGVVHPWDVGIFQINLNPEKTDWAKVGKELGYDPYTIEGNVELAMYIAKNYGYQHWVCLGLI